MQVFKYYKLLSSCREERTSQRLINEVTKHQKIKLKKNVCGCDFYVNIYEFSYIVL